MTFENLQSDAPATGRKMVRQALLLTRVSLIAMTTALMPLTLGGLHNPVVSKAAFAQSASDDGTADQGSGDVTVTDESTDASQSSDGASGSDDSGDSADSSGGSDDGATHDVGDDGDGGGSGSGGDSGGEGGGSGGGGGDD
jgi:hypothetical protein